jgi:hypothetical protein
MPEYPLSFPIVAGSPAPLRDIATAAAEISKQLKLSKGEVQYFNASVKEGTDKGQSLIKTLSDISKSSASAGPGVASLAAQLKGLTREYQSLEAAKAKAYKSAGTGPGSEMEKEAQRVKSATAAVASALKIGAADFEKFKTVTNQGLEAGKGLGAVLGEIASAKSFGPGVALLATQIQGISHHYDELREKEKAHRKLEEENFAARKVRMRAEEETRVNSSISQRLGPNAPPQRAKDPVVLQLEGLSQSSLLQKLEPQFRATALAAKLTSGEIGAFNALLSSSVKSGQDFEKSLGGIAKAAAGTKIGTLATDLKGVIQGERDAIAAAETAAAAKVKAFRENFRSGVYAAQITGHMGPMGGNLAGIGRHGANLINIFSSPVGLATTAVTGVLALTAGLYKAAEAAGKLAKEQGNAAEKTSLSIHDYSLMAAAATEAGVAENTLTTAQRTLSRALSENSSEGRAAKEALQQIGVTATNAMGGFVGGRKFLEDFDTALQKLSGPAKEDLILKVFGRGGLEMLPLFNGRLKETLGTLQSVGAGFDELSARSARRFEDTLDRLSTKLGAFKRDVGVWAAEAAGFEDPVKQRMESIRRQKEGRTRLTETSGWELLSPSVIPNALKDISIDAYDVAKNRLKGLIKPGTLSRKELTGRAEGSALQKQIEAEQQLIEEYTKRAAGSIMPLSKADQEALNKGKQVSREGRKILDEWKPGPGLSDQERKDLASWRTELPKLLEQQRAASTPGGAFTKSDIEARQIASYRERMTAIGDQFDEGSKIGRTAQIERNIQNLEKKVADLRAPGHTPQLAPGEAFQVGADRDAKALQSFGRQIESQKQLLQVEAKREGILREIETIQERSAEMQDKARYQNFGRVGELTAQRRAMDRDFDKQLLDLSRKQKEENIPALAPDYANARNAIAENRKIRTDANNAELLKAVNDQAQAEARSRSLVPRSLAQGRSRQGALLA